MATSPSLQLKVLPGKFCIHRFGPSAVIPTEVQSGGLTNICRTDEELSIVCADTIRLDSDRCDAGWSGIKVVGPLDFSMTGILARLSGLLAEAGISIFVISTYDTDYILIKSVKLDRAVAILKTGGYVFA